MARTLGPDPGSRYLPPFAGRSIVMYTDEAAAVSLASILAYDPAAPTVPGAAVAGSKLRIDANNRVDQFWFPDGASRVWGRISRGGPVVELGAAVAGGGSVTVGTTSGTVAAGDDSRITGAAQKSANLTDLASPPAGRTALGLGGAALLAVGTGAGTVAAGNAAPTAHAKSHGRGGSDDLFLLGGHGRTSAIENGPRWAFVTVAQAISAGRQYFEYFTPSNDLTITQMDMVCGTAQVGATVIRMGLCTVAGNGDLTLVARTANDLTIFATLNSNNLRSFDTTGGYPASYALLAGTRYAYTYLVVSGGTIPTIWGPAAIGPNTDSVRNIAPYISRYNTGTPADLASCTFANTSGYATAFYMAGVA